MSGAAHHHALGERGEEAAAQWYERQGFVVAERNWRVKEGELDLVCVRQSSAVFVEVKTRTSGRFGAGVEAVGWKKQQKLRQLARLWLAQTDAFYSELRFDVVDVDARGHLQVFEACF